MGRRARSLIVAGLLAGCGRIGFDPGGHGGSGGDGGGDGGSGSGDGGGTCVPNGTFAPYVAYPMGVGVSDFAVADIDGDASPDVVTPLAYFANLLHVHRNRGDGVLTLDQTTYPTAASPGGVVVTSLDDLPGPDVLVALTSIDKLELRSSDGAGGFGPPTSIGLPSSPREIVAEDFDGDGDRDLAVARAAAGVVVLENLGAGLFGAPSSYPTQVNPAGLVAGKVDDDGDLDLVNTNYGSASVNVFLGDSASSFQPIGATTVEVRPTALALGNLDPDPGYDLAVANEMSGTVSLLFNTGTGTFGPQVVVAVGGSPHGLAILDVDRDGKNDLLVSVVETSAVVVIRNAGGGAFVLGSPIPTSPSPTKIVVHDMNGDGAFDLVVGSGLGLGEEGFVNVHLAGCK